MVIQPKLTPLGAAVPQVSRGSESEIHGEIDLQPQTTPFKLLTLVHVENVLPVLGRSMWAVHRSKNQGIRYSGREWVKTCIILVTMTELSTAFCRIQTPASH